MPDDSHIPVLLDEALAALHMQSDGVYIDGTFGRGGHTSAMLAALAERGRVIALDRDPAAAAVAAEVCARDARLVFRRAWFSELPDVLASLQVERIDGVLLDLGISSPQIDDATRGFSFRNDGPLDMRMDPTRGESVAQFLAHASVAELTEVIRDYGEERFARSIATAIATARTVAPILGTRQLAALVAKAVGARTRGDWSQDPAARTFQALRIFINRELSELESALPAIVTLLREGGRVVVISFHSLEDRIVKQFFARASQPFAGDPVAARLSIPESALPGTPLRLVGRAVKASPEEVARNPRSRSAVLRCAERSAHPLPPRWPRGYIAEHAR